MNTTSSMHSEKDLERSDHVADYTPSPDRSEEEDSAYLKKIKRKVDIRLSCILALMYIVNQIDRTNLPMACVCSCYSPFNNSNQILTDSFPASSPAWTKTSISSARTATP